MNSFEHQCRDFNRQQKCKHAKGLSHRTHRDSSVHMHTFIDGRTRIWCIYCPFEAWNDPAFSFKWQYALFLWERGCEHASSSERIVPPHMGPETNELHFRFTDLDKEYETRKMVPRSEEFFLDRWPDNWLEKREKK